MNQKLFDQIAREYSFLDDIEKESSIKSQSKIPTSNIKANVPQDKSPPQQDNVRYLNNYPKERKEVPQNENVNELNQAKENYNKTRYGKFVSKELDPEKLNDLDYLYETLEVNRNVKSVNEMNEQSDHQAFKDSLEVLKKFEYRFYAFLNKEFNILNKKMIKCSMMCYDDPSMFTVNEAKLCAENCHKNIKEAAKFAEDLQDKKRCKLLECIENSRDFKADNAGDDKIVSFLKCYDVLIEDFGDMEKEIRREFSYYI